MRTRLSGARAVCAALVLAAALPARADRLTIDQALRRALQRHPDVEVAAADLEAAGGQVTAARTRTYNPELGVAAGPAWGGGDTVLDYELSLSQTFELGGKRSRRTDAARARQEAALARLRWSREQVVARVRRAFAFALIERQRLGVEVQAQNVADELRAAAAERLRLGAGTQLEVNVALAATGRARHDRVDAERSYELAVVELSTAMAAPPEEVLDPVGDIGAFPVPPLQEAAYVEQARRRRGDLAAAGHEREAAEAEVALAGALGTPDLTVAVSYGRSEGTHIALVGISMPIPIFNRNRGGRAAARAGLKRARLVEGSTGREVERGVRAALRAYAKARESVEAFDREVVDRLDENLELARESLRTGNIGLFEFNIVRRDLFETQLAYLDALAEAADARFALESAAAISLGGTP